jgi:hypothetical protein
LPCSWRALAKMAWPGLRSRFTELSPYSLPPVSVVLHAKSTFHMCSAALQFFVHSKSAFRLLARRSTQTAKLGSLFAAGFTATHHSSSSDAESTGSSPTLSSPAPRRLGYTRSTRRRVLSGRLPQLALSRRRENVIRGQRSLMERFYMLLLLLARLNISTRCAGRR